MFLYLKKKIVSKTAHPEEDILSIQVLDRVAGEASALSPLVPENSPLLKP